MLKQLSRLNNYLLTIMQLFRMVFRMDLSEFDNLDIMLIIANRNKKKPW